VLYILCSQIISTKTTQKDKSSKQRYALSVVYDRIQQTYVNALLDGNQTLFELKNLLFVNVVVFI